MAIQISPNLPANVVEIGNEITQAKINEINAGTLALQTWVSASYLTTASASSTYQTISGMSSYLTTSSASSTYAPKASPTFTGTVTIPAGASITGYLTTSSASSTYQTIAGMSSYATQSYVTSQGYLTDAPSNGSEYVRKNGAWAVATGGGGGGGISDAPSDGNLYARQNAAWTSFSIPAASVTNIDLTGNFNGYSVGSGNYTFKFDSTANTLRMQDGSGSGITISPTGITFPNSSVQSASSNKNILTITGTDYTFPSALTNNILYIPNDIYTTIYLRVPEDSVYDFAIGTVIDVCFNLDTSASIVITTTGAGSPNLIGNTGGISGGQAGRRTFIKLSANFWFIS